MGSGAGGAHGRGAGWRARQEGAVKEGTREDGGVEGGGVHMAHVRRALAAIHAALAHQRTSDLGKDFVRFSIS